MNITSDQLERIVRKRLAAHVRRGLSEGPDPWEQINSAKENAERAVGGLLGAIAARSPEHSHYAKRAVASVQRLLTIVSAQVQAEGRINELGGKMTGKNAASVQSLKTHLNGAKQALSDIFQGTGGGDAASHAEVLLHSINKLIRAVDAMPGLSGTGV